jgi:hypothetical protein
MVNDELSTASARAKSTTTEFEATLVACGRGESAREWYDETEGTIWHIRNMVYQTPIYSDDDRMAAMRTWRTNQDMNLTTGDGRAWGPGIIETARGTWHVVIAGGYEGWVGFSEAKAAGVDGLQAYKMTYIGSIGGVPPENPCAPDDPYVVMTLTGQIENLKGE